MNRFETLWKAYREGVLPEAELTEFLELIRDADSPLAGKIDELLQQGSDGMPPPGEKERILHQIRERIQPASPKVHFLKRYRWVAAAACLLLTGAIAWFTLHKSSPQDITGTGRQPSPVYDAAPGKYGAQLTLSDGTTILLDSASNGTLAVEGNTKVIKTDSGKLIYTPPVEGAQGAVVYNTMTTQRGRQFQLTLPDGSKVWLNAASSIAYPTAFTPKERKVSITGEAYFEINAVQDPAGNKIPFLIDMLTAPGGKPEAQVEVLGTHFNINAYTDEGAIRATLLEGKIKITPSTGPQPTTQDLSRLSGGSKLLAPGQQALLPLSASSNQPAPITIRTIDAEAVVAWKNGLFNFHKVSLPTLMRQLARWYDVEVVYRGPVPGRLFGGEIERNLHLSQVIKILGKMGVQCTIEDKKLIVLSS
jgi:ferric-dicitrate binding protein FerR (iron transport regulator)